MQYKRQIAFYGTSMNFDHFTIICDFKTYIMLVIRPRVIKSDEKLQVLITCE